MQVIFKNDQTVEIEMNSTPLALAYKKIIKHLQHVPLDFRDWDNPNFLKSIELPHLVDQLIYYGSLVGVAVDKNLCLQQSQEYFNTMHILFEKGYDGNPDWLKYHENLHLCESYPEIKRNSIALDYREKAGLLIKPIDPALIQNIQTSVSAGDAFVTWSELGKHPYVYWRDKEPNDLKRLCELAKPWITFIPTLRIAFNEASFEPLIDVQQFNSWWSNYEEDWCRYWKIKEWKLHHMCSAVVIGHVQNFDTFRDLVEQNIAPIYVKL